MSPGDAVVMLVILAMITVVITIVVVTRYLGASRQARAQLTSGQEYRSLADEFRRLGDMAITTQEHIDLRLTDPGVQVDSLRDRLDHMQHILTEVE
jgi:hypothetical protein